MEEAVTWFQSSAFPIESEYPWKGERGASCNPNGAGPLAGARVGSWEKLNNLTDEELRSALNSGPVIVKLTGDKSTIENFQAGNVISNCGNNPNTHGEFWGTLVGFHNKNWVNEDNGHVIGKRTWRIKMANGPNYGDGGYIWIDVNGGICGVNSEVYILTSANY